MKKRKMFLTQIRSISRIAMFSVFVMLAFSFSTKGVTKNLVTDFGAVGDGVTDDSHAFLKAWLFFTNQRMNDGSLLPPGQKNVDYTIENGELIIPAYINGNLATYLVGLQLYPGEYITLNYTAQGGGNVTPQILDNIPFNNWTSFEWGEWNLQNPATFPANPQIYGTSFARKPVTLLDMNACRWGPINGFTVKGDDELHPSKIQYKDELYFGTFYYPSPGTSPLVPYNIPLPNATVANLKYTAQAGSFIDANHADNVTIKNLAISGKNSKYILGGPYTDAGNGSQLAPDGIILRSSNGITINNVKFTEMGRDGVAIAGASQNAYITNSEFTGNGRNGIAWVGGNNINFDNCISSNNGQTINDNPINIPNNIKMTSLPAAGLDIEPETTNPCMGPETASFCTNGYFKKCTMINNAGNQMVNDNFHADNVHFEDCWFHDVNSYAVWAKGKKLTFTKCKIWGGFVFGNSGDFIGNETKFYQCDFADEEIPNEPFVGNVHLVESNNWAKRMLFDDCTFRLIHNNAKFIWLYSAAGINTESEYTKIKNCNFTVGSNATLNGAANVLWGVQFDGKNNFVNNNSNTLCKLLTNGLVFKGSDNLCDPYLLSLEGKMCFSHANSNGSQHTQFVFGRNSLTGNTDKYFKFSIGEKSCLYTYYGTAYDIGKYSLLLNKGQIISLSGAFNNEGKIVFDYGNHNKIFGTSNNTTTTTNGGEFYIHKNSEFDFLNPIWAAFGPFSTDWSNMLQGGNAKFDGGNQVPLLVSHSSTPYEALEFNGTNDYVDIPFINKLNYAPNGVITNGFPPVYNVGNPGTVVTDFTIEIPFKHVGTAKGCIFSQGANFEIGISSADKIYVKFPVYSGQPTVYYSTNTVGPECHTVVLKRTNGTLRIFLDGLLFHTIGANSSVLTTNGDDIKLGYGATGYYFKGWIGQVRIWDKALPDCEIFYNFGRKLPFDLNGPLADWDLSCPTATCSAVSDAIFPEANGTLMGGASWVHQNQIGDCTIPYMNFKTDETNEESIEEHIENGEHIVLYPNPNSGKFTLSINGIQSKTVSLQVIDVSGRVIYNQFVDIPENHITKSEIQLPSPGPGVYIMKISSDKENFVRSFIVE